MFINTTQSVLFKQALCCLLTPMDASDVLLLTGVVGTKTRFFSAFALFALFLNKAYLTHLLPVFLELLY